LSEIAHQVPRSTRFMGTTI